MPCAGLEVAPDEALVITVRFLVVPRGPRDRLRVALEDDLELLKLRLGVRVRVRG